uniref:Carboxypeptidase n=1 Tax=Oryza nivara TaxID=4536 RepID=A0A0E0JB26_ORYNI
MAPPLLLVSLLLIGFVSARAITPSAEAAAVFPKEALPTNSGYLPITTTNASLFFAYYEATHPLTPPASTPLLLWLQGGPGCSGLAGNFFELGPYFVNRDALSLSPNPFSWNRRFGLLFIDNPLGTGFSAAPSPAAIPTNQSVVAAHLFAALQSFFALQPGSRSRPFFLTGESYAGKAVELTNAARWSEAADARELVLSWLENATGLATLFDAAKQRPYETGPVGKFVNRAEVKVALGARGDVEWEECSDAVGAAMHGDVMKSVKPEVEALLRGTRVLLYQGIRDLRDGVVSTEAWMRELEWDGLPAFLDADRAVWRIGEELAGYVQRSGPLSHVVVYGAGHLMPADNGRAAQEMIEDWVLQAGLFGRHGGMKRAA